MNRQDGKISVSSKSEESITGVCGNIIIDNLQQVVKEYCFTRDKKFKQALIKSLYVKSNKRLGALFTILINKL
ncbi:MAG: hypothetical protein WC998_09510 [Candidatus Paceibacterota bacterium]|jgi:hypothetical protein